MVVKIDFSRIVGLSTDEKPVLPFTKDAGTVFFELDTQKSFYWNTVEWATLDAGPNQTSFLGLLNIASYDGLAGKHLVVNSGETGIIAEDVPVPIAQVTQGDLKSDGTVLMVEHYLNTDPRAIATVGLLMGVTPLHTDGAVIPPNSYGKNSDTFTVHSVSTQGVLVTGTSAEAYDTTSKSTKLIDSSLSVGGEAASPTTLVASVNYGTITFGHLGGGVPHEDTLLELETNGTMVSIPLIFKGVYVNQTFWSYDKNNSTYNSAIEIATTDTIYSLKGKRLSGRTKNYKKVRDVWLFQNLDGVEDVEQTIVGDFPTKLEMISALGKISNIDYALDEHFTMYNGAYGAATKGFTVHYYANGATTAFGAHSTIWATKQYLGV